MKKILLPILILSGCGGGGDQPDISIVNNNTATNNNNSQNGDTQCKYHCEPVQFDGGIGYLVTQECDGNSNGPDFSPTCPNASLAAAAPADGATAVADTSAADTTDTANLGGSAL